MEIGVVDGEYDPPETPTTVRVTGGGPARAGASPMGDRRLGYLLDEPDESKVAKRVQQLWDRQTPAMKDRMARWRCYRLWREGRRYVRLKVAQDELRVYVPPQTSDLPPEPNKADTLVRRVVATLMADPPQVEAEPSTDAAEDRDAAEFATRVLNTDGTESGLNIRAVHEDALDKSGSYCSAFVYACVDPHGGGQRPVQVLAHPAAVSIDPDPRRDPTTGADGPPYVLKYVQEDGSLSESGVGARVQWLPTVRLKVLTGHHVRFLPEVCEGLSDAEGVLLCLPITLGLLRSQFETEDAPWSDEMVKAIAAYQPLQHDQLLPAWMKRADHADQRTLWHEGKPSDDVMVFPLLVYRTACVEYPKGCYVVTAAGKYVLHRQPWSAVTVGQQGAEVEEMLDLPLSQVRQLDDHQLDDPYGSCFMAKVGPMDEIRASIWGALLDYLDRFLRPNVYLPLGSNIQPGQSNKRDGTPILYNAAGKPEFEVIPPFPREGHEALAFVSREMDSAVGLEQAAQGVATPSVQSGRHAQQIIEQALVALSGVKHNSDDAFIRLNRVILQLYRAFYTVPQRLKYFGVDGRYKEREWTRADLGTSRDIRLRRGTSTLLPMSAKIAIAREELEIAAKFGDPEAYQRYKHVTSANLSPTIGEEDDPVALRVRQQIADWEEGPAESVEAEAASYVPQPETDALGQPVLDPATGEPVSAPHPLTRAGAALFAPRANDEMPTIAPIRLRELSQAMCGARYAKQAPEWRAAYDQEFERMRAASGVQTVREQQAAQQAQAQAASEAQQVDAESKLAEADKDRAVARESQQSKEALAQQALAQRVLSGPRAA